MRAFYILTDTNKNKVSTDTYAHTHGEGEKPFYLILSAIHEYVLFYVCWVIFRWWLFFVYFLNHFWTVFFFPTHNVYANNVFDWDTGSLLFLPTQIQIKLIANCWHFFIVYFSLFCLTQSEIDRESVWYCLTMRMFYIWLVQGLSLRDLFSTIQTNASCYFRFSGYVLPIVELFKQ